MEGANIRDLLALCQTVDDHSSFRRAVVERCCVLVNETSVGSADVESLLQHVCFASLADLVRRLNQPSTGDVCSTSLNAVATLMQRCLCRLDSNDTFRARIESETLAVVSALDLWVDSQHCEQHLAVTREYIAPICTFLMYFLREIHENALGGVCGQLCDLCLKFCSHESPLVRNNGLQFLAPALFCRETIARTYFDDFLARLFSVQSDVGIRLEIACGLSELIFESNFCEVRLRLLYDCTLVGLTHNDQLSRKRARYVLRCLIDCVTAEHSSVCCDLIPHETVNSAGVWNDLLLLLAVLEEKQVHIIKPMLPRCDALIASGSCVPICIGLCVLRRALNHANSIIRRWAVLKSLHFSSNSEDVAAFFLDYVLPALNDGDLFSDVDVGSMMRRQHANDTECGQQLAMFLMRFSSGDGGFDRVNKFIARVFSLNWCPVALCHLSLALYHLRLEESFEVYASAIADMCSFFSNTLPSFDSSVVEIVTCCILSFILRHWNPTGCSIFSSLVDIASILSKLSWYRSIENQPPSPFVCNALSEKIGAHNLEEFVEKSSVDPDGKRHPIHLLALAFVFVKHLDSSFCDERLLKLLCRSLTNCDTDLYQPQSCVISNIAALNELLHYRLADLFQVDPAILTSIVAYIDHLCKCTDYSSINSIIHCSRFVDFLFSQRSKLLSDFDNGGMTCRTLFYVLVCIQYPFLSDIPPAVIVTIVGILGQAKHINVRAWLDTQEYSLLENLALSALSLDASALESAGRRLNTEPTELGRWNCENAWSILSFLSDDKSRFCTQRIITPQVFLTALHSCSRQCLVLVIEAARKMISCFSASDLERIAEAALRAAFEYRKSETFAVCIGCISKLLINYETFALSGFTDKLSELLERSIELCDSTDVFLYELLQALYPLILRYDHQNPSRSSLFCRPLSLGISRIICAGLLYGPLHRRHLQCLHDTLLYATKSCSQRHLATCASRSRVRSTSINILLRLLYIESTRDDRGLVNKESENSPSIRLDQCEPVEFWGDVLRETLSQAAAVLFDVGAGGRHFANSLAHRRQQRVAQVLLLAASVMDHEYCATVLQRSLDVLLSHAALQTSVRCLLQWLCVVVCRRFSQLSHHVWLYLNKATEERTALVSTFIVIIHRLCSTHNCPPQFVDQCFTTLLPYSMAQHFSTRLSALVTISHVWNVAMECGLEATVRPYSSMYTAVCEALSRGNITLSTATRPSHKDLLLTELDCERCFTLETILLELPRLCGVQCDEWLCHWVLSYCCDCFDHSQARGWPRLAVSNSHDTVAMLHRLQPVSCGARADEASVTSLCDNDTSAAASDRRGDGAVQRKLAPWRRTQPSHQAHNVTNDCASPGSGRVVLMASLVDRPPNLGGLCRTCEVFGVSEMTVHNKCVLNDTQFRNLSVSSDKWMPITQVSSNDVCEFLRAKRAEGYQLVGLEQTSTSVSLTTCSLRDDCVIVLGHEREGIPVRILQMLDLLLEIPQCGVVRSLNVHVAGALVLWEYRRQHPPRVTAT